MNRRELLVKAAADALDPDCGRSRKSSVCRACPAADRCLEFALATESGGNGNGADYGWPVYGGLTRLERLALRRAARRTTPAKVDGLIHAARAAEAVVTAEAVAHALGVHANTVRKWSNKGLLPVAPSSGLGRRYRLSEVNQAVRFWNLPINQQAGAA